MDDRLHQPYRARLFPWMAAVAGAARAAGALGCVLSGAGPSLLAVAVDRAEAVAGAMEVALAEAGLRGRAQVLAVDEVGATCRPQT
jgi:homoserine kinase